MMPKVDVLTTKSTSLYLPFSESHVGITLVCRLPLQDDMPQIPQPEVALNAALALGIPDRDIDNSMVPSVDFLTRGGQRYALFRIRFTAYFEVYDLPNGPRFCSHFAERCSAYMEMPGAAVPQSWSFRRGGLWDE